jgi:outer membrane protein with beta-barrel domain
MLKTIHIALTILFCASLATAQSTEYKKLDVYAGYTISLVAHSIGDETIPEDPEDFRGINASITKNVSRYVGLKFEFSGHQNVPNTTFIKRDSNLYNFLGGIQIKDNSSEKTFKPFVHALVGVAHIRNRITFSDSFCAAISPRPCPADFTERNTGLASAFGGGLDIRVSDRLDVRVFQLDYNPTRLFDTSQPTMRLAIGIVFH